MGRQSDPTSVKSRVLAFMTAHPTPWRAKQLAEAMRIQEVSRVATAMWQLYDEGKGPLTRCVVQTPQERVKEQLEYRIAAGAAGTAARVGPSSMLNTAGRPIVRRDENQAPIPSHFGASAKPEKVEREKKAKKARPEKTRKTRVAKPAGAKDKRAGRSMVGTSPPPVTHAHPGFRCAMFSDGALAIEAAQGSIELSEPDTRALFDYLDRVVRAAAA